MFLVEGARRVQGEVALEVLQAQEQRAVERHAQLVHQPQVAIAGHGLARLQPLDAVAADALAHRLAGTAPHRGRGQLAGGGALAALRGQGGDQVRGQEVALQRPAPFGQVVDGVLQGGGIGMRVHALL